MCGRPRGHVTSNLRNDASCYDDDYIERQIARFAPRARNNPPKLFPCASMESFMRACFKHLLCDYGRAHTLRLMGFFVSLMKKKHGE